MASFAVLAQEAILADCDVDAADLHLIFAPQTKRRETFTGGKKARIDSDRCAACGKCARLCRFEAIAEDESSGTFGVDPAACEGCGICARFCPVDAIELACAPAGEWYISETRCGPLVHAQLGPGAGNSGKLVAMVRAEARKLAREKRASLILTDGSPGIGCPVLASLTGASRVIAVTEPTVSGEHDLERVLRLIHQFNLPVAVCINKADLNPTVARRIEQLALASGATLLSRVPYDPAVTAAQRQGLAVVEWSDSPAAQSIRHNWEAFIKPSL